MERRLFAVLTLVVGAAASGCSSADTGSKPGELGNGGFYFSCSDAVSCARYSNDAAKFPQAVSLGSSFQVRFVSNPNVKDLHITFNEQAPDRGITITPVGEYVSRGPSGLVALKRGYATLTSRDASGLLIDFVTVRVAKPDALVVYSADDVGENPRVVDAIALAKAERRTYRAFAQEKKSVLGGTLAVEWKSSDTNVVDIESTTDGKATLVGRAAGKARLIASGGTFEQQVPIEVTP